MATWKKIITSGSDANLKSLTLDTALPVAQGGTGADTLTANGVLIGNGTSAVTAVDLSTDGVIVIGDGSGNPTTLDVGSSGGITILGTIATGVWQGTAIASEYLDADTAHLSTTQTFTGLKTFSAAITASENISSSKTITALNFKNDGAVANTILTGSFSGSFTGELNGVGVVDVSGTPANNQLAIWTDANTIEGDVDVTYDGSNMLIGGTAGTTQLQFGDSGTYIYQQQDGHLDIVSDSDVGIQATTIDIDGAVDISGNTVIGGDLTVNGTTTTVSSTNVTVGDQLLFLATGSEGTNKDSGIVALSGSLALTGSALYHDADSERWSVAKTVKADDTAVTPLQHVVTVRTHNDSPADGEYGVGEMHIDLNEDDGAGNGTIYIRTA